jgi:hypothetical protein
MSVQDISEAQFAQGDVVGAAQTIIRHKLPLNMVGAAECERQMREAGVGNRTLWMHPRYLRTAIHLAQAIIREVRAAESEPAP